MPVRERKTRKLFYTRIKGLWRQVYVLVLLYIWRERHVVVVYRAEAETTGPSRPETS